MGGVAAWLAAWIVLFLLLFGLAKSRAGHTIIYYWAWLLVVLLIITHPNSLTSVLSGGEF